MTLQTASSLPLFEQVMQHIRTQVQTGQVAAGYRLPSETELCLQYDVSRITIRRALKELEEEGLLERRQGKGTFIARQKIPIHAMALGGFQGMTQKEKREDSHIAILHKSSRPATKKEASLLGIQPQDPVYELTRRLEIKNEPIMLDRTIYDARRFPGLLDMVHDNVSTYELMSQTFHHQNWRVDKEITITMARPDEALNLQCHTGEVLFYIVETVYDEQGIANHCSFELVIANRVKMTLSYTR